MYQRPEWTTGTCFPKSCRFRHRDQAHTPDLFPALLNGHSPVSPTERKQLV